MICLTMLLCNTNKNILQKQHNIPQSIVQSDDLLDYMEALNLEPHWYSVSSIITLFLMVFTNHGFRSNYLGHE